MDCMRAIILYFTDRAECGCDTLCPPPLRFVMRSGDFFVRRIACVQQKERIEGKIVNEAIRIESLPLPETLRRLGGWLKLARAVREFAPKEKKSRKKSRRAHSR